MKRAIQTFVSLLCVSAAIAQGTTQIVVPNGLANTEGNASSADLFINGEARMLQVYAASDFTFGAPTGRIDGISFRLDETSGAVIGSWNISIFLSTTTRSPDSLTPVYSSNHGDDGVIVVNGGFVGIFSTNTSVGPRPFQVQIPFTTPFFYDLSRGNLAVDIVASGTRNALFDAAVSPIDSVGRVFGQNALSGTVDTLGLITRFDITPIPEPSIIALSTICAALLLFFMRRETTDGR